MIVRLKEGLLLVTAESADEQTQIATWASLADGHVFALRHQDPRTVKLRDLGAEADACRLPLNITSQVADPVLRLISNLAGTTFELDSRTYASVEAFWQGLKFPDATRREQIARLSGLEARAAGADAISSDVFEYDGRPFRTGTHEHWTLMKRACRAKFTQHQAAREALLGTGERPLVHRTRSDSRTIPGVMLAEIWMKLRKVLSRQASPR